MNSVQTVGPSFWVKNERMIFLAMMALALIAIISIAAVGASDDSDAYMEVTVVDDGVYYRISGSEAFVTECCIGTYSGDIVIKSQVSWNDTAYDVTSIGSGAFRDCASITSVTVPSSVTYIDYYAFAGCTGLTEISLPGVTDIQDHAFSGCVDLTSISMPAVTNIGYYVFKDCLGLTSFEVPATLTYLEGSAFAGCTNISAFTVASGNTAFTAVDGVLYNYDKSILSNYPAGRTASSYTLPNTVEYLNMMAFCRCVNLTSVAVESGVSSFYVTDGVLFKEYSPTDKTLAYYPAGKTASSYTIPDDVNVLWSCCFSGNTSLTSMTIPATVTTIYSFAFDGCTGLTDITVPGTINSFYECAFNDCTGLLSATVNTDDLPSNTFCGCTSLETINLGDNMSSMDSYLADYAALKNINVSSGNTTFSSIDGVLFSKDGKSLIFCPVGKTGTYTVPAGTEVIEYGAFRNCSGLTSIILPDLTGIYAEAFYGCSGLTAVTIPASVIEMYEDTFVGCSSLTEIVVDPSNTICKSLDGVLFAKDGTAIIAYPAARTGTSYDIPAGVTTISPNAFYGCTSLESIAVPATVNEIMYYAFYGCTSLTTISFASASPAVLPYADLEFAAGSDDLKMLVPSSALSAYKNGWPAYAPNLFAAITGSMIGEIGSQIYSSTALEPAFTVKDGSVTLVKGTDYTVVYSDNVNAGAAKATVIGMGTYGGSAFKTFVIAPKAVIVKANDASKSQGSRDPALTATVTGLIGSDTVSYTLARASGEEMGTYVITASGDAVQGNYAVTYENGTFTITEPAPAKQNDWYFWVWVIPMALFIIHMLVLTYREMKKE